MEYLVELRKKYDIIIGNYDAELIKCKCYIAWVHMNPPFSIFMGYYLGLNKNNKLVFTRDLNACDSPPDDQEVLGMVTGNENVTILNNNNNIITFENVELKLKINGGTLAKRRLKRRSTRRSKRRSNRHSRRR